MIQGKSCTLTVAKDGGYYALYLPEGEHTAEETIARVVAPLLVAQHRHAVVHAHGQRGVLLLENPDKLNKVGTAAKVARLGEVAVGENA